MLAFLASAQPTNFLPFHFPENNANTRLGSGEYAIQDSRQIKLAMRPVLASRR